MSQMVKLDFNYLKTERRRARRHVVPAELPDEFRLGAPTELPDKFRLGVPA